MSALDSSVIVAALAQWHEAHDEARKAAHHQLAPLHALMESYAVLTRLPAPRRLGALTARDLLTAWFPPSRILEPHRGSAAQLLRRMCEAGVSGGATYDALVALTAEAHGEELLTRDRRAEATYLRLGVAYRLLS